MVEVFKTNVNTKKEAFRVLKILAEKFPHLKINFDLRDCDRILRIEGDEISPLKIIHILQAERYLCAALE